MPSIVNDRELRGADFSVGICPMVTKGTVPVSPVFTPVRRTEGKGMKAIGYVEDPEVVEIGQATTQIEDTVDLTAEISASFSKQSVDLLVQAIHADTAAIVVSEDDIAITATGFTSVSEDFDDLEVGDGFWLTGATNPLNNVFYIITAKANDGEITTYPAPAATEAAGVTMTLTTQKSVNADLPTYNLLQTRATDLSAAGNIDYHALVNAVVNTLSVEIGETGIVTATTSMVAESELTGQISGQTYAAKLTDRAVTSKKGAQSSIKAFFVNNVAATCSVKSLSFEVTNNYIKDDAAGCDAYYVRGQFAVSGSVAIRSKISSPFIWRNYMWNATRVAIGVLIQHGSGEETYIVFRRNVVTENTMPDGNNVVANSEATFVSELDPTSAHTIAVYRNWTL